MEDENWRRRRAIEILEGATDIGAVDDQVESPWGEDDLDRAARVTAGLGSADSLIQRTALRNDLWSQLNQTAPFSRINPPSVLKGTIGNQVLIPIPGTSQGTEPIQVVNWGGDDAETLPITVTVSPVPPSPSLGFIPQIRAFAKIQFGTRAALVQAEIDVGAGRQLTLSGSYVTVSVGMETNIVAPTEPVSVPYVGMISFYPIVRTSQLTRTKYIDGVVYTDSIVAVPPFAESVIVVRSNPNTSALTVDFAVDENAAYVPYTTFLAINQYMTEPVPLSQEIRYVRVTDTAVASAKALIFNLSL